MVPGLAAGATVRVNADAIGVTGVTVVSEVFLFVVVVAGLVLTVRRRRAMPLDDDDEDEMYYCDNCGGHFYTSWNFDAHECGVD